MSSTETSDSGMTRMMVIVLGALCLLTVIIVATARMLAGDGHDSTDMLMRNALVQRIAPVGKVRTEATASDSAASTTTASLAAETPKTPEELVNGACAVCHLSGVGGAPKIGDEAAWIPRKALGLEALVASVVNGKGAMPAGGGSAYSAEDIERAVKHLVGIE